MRNPYTGSTFLLAALPASLLLLQWYEPLQKFLLLKVWGGWGEDRAPSSGWQRVWGWGGWRPEHPCCPQNFSSPMPSPVGLLEPLVLEGKELPQVCVGAEGPEGPGCRVLFHVLPLEAGLTPDVLIPPGKREGWAAACAHACAWVRACVNRSPASLQLGSGKRFHCSEGSVAEKKLTNAAGAAGAEPSRAQWAPVAPVLSKGAGQWVLGQLTGAERVAVGKGEGEVHRTKLALSPAPNQGSNTQGFFLLFFFLS